MSSGHRYKHENCLDMNIYVVKVTYRGANYIKCRIAYVDDNGRSYAGGTEVVKIMRKDLKRWKFVE